MGVLREGDLGLGERFRRALQDQLRRGQAGMTVRGGAVEQRHVLAHDAGLDEVAAIGLQALELPVRANASGRAPGQVPRLMKRRGCVGHVPRPSERPPEGKECLRVTGRCDHSALERK